PIAHGNDGGGSIRIPAACCGLVGLKPSRGRTKDNAAAASIPINIISEGVLTRSVRDTAAFFYGIEQIYQNPKLPPIGRVEGPGKKRLRIGVVIDSITGTPTDTETRATIEKTVQLLSAMGHRVETMPLPVASEFLEDFALYWGFLAVLITGFGRIAVSPDFDTHKIEPLTRGLIDYYRKRILKTPGMFIRMAQADKTYTEAFQGWDAVLTPVTGHTVPRLGHLSPSLSFEELWERLKAYVSFTPLNNAAGTPAISLPMGMTQEGLPIGVMLQTIPGGERTLLELAYELEAAHPWVKITQ
ncbi:MAG TPA: amidase, partial [Turneriella sp.]|nr:amidase [Turneriella sp.]